MTMFKEIITVDVKDDTPPVSETIKILTGAVTNALESIAPTVERYAKTASFRRKGKRGVINKIKGPYSLRYITGDLRDSIKTTVTARQLILSAGNYMVPYALVQEVGGKVGSAIGNTAATIPARPFITPVMDGIGVGFTQAVLDTLVRNMGKQ